MTGATPAAGTNVLVTRVGEAEGAREIAAALACAGSDSDRAGLLVELGGCERTPRPALVATAAARSLEERLASHLPGAAAAARGRLCHLVAPAGESGIEAARAAQPLVRDCVCVVLAPPGSIEAVLGLAGLRISSILVRADLENDRALAALAVRALMDKGLSVTVAKRPLPWGPARLALFGALTVGARGVPGRVIERCLR